MPITLRRKAPAFLAAILLMAAGALYQQYVIRTQRGQLEEDAKQLRALRAQPQRVGAQQQPAPAAASRAMPEARGNEPRRWPSGGTEDMALAKGELDRVRRELAASQGTVDQLNAQIRTLQADHVKALTEADQQAAAMDARWKESLDNANLTLDGVRSDLRAAKQEVAQLQADNQALQEAKSSSNAQTAETVRLMAQYQDLARRREAYLNTVLQRFRDVTRQYRSFAAVVGARRNDQPGPVIDDADFGRIVSALTSSQDDLRQVETLNGQAQQIEKRLAKK